jgi:hypothetical protein
VRRQAAPEEVGPLRPAIAPATAAAPAPAPVPAVTTVAAAPPLVPAPQSSSAAQGGAAHRPELPPATETRIAYLEGRVAALEAALCRRSAELCLIQRHVCRRDLILISRLLAGLPLLPRGAYEPAFWQETTALTGADVDATLEDLWSSVLPAGLAGLAEQGDRER